jgi:1-acyl-sn-glycerol-3-phosphate acyltransferase
VRHHRAHARFQSVRPGLPHGERIVRFLLHFLTSPTREGLANVPQGGPVIVAGNHISTFDPIVLRGDACASASASLLRDT